MTAAEKAASDASPEAIRRAGELAAMAASRSGVAGAADAAREKAEREAPAKAEAARAAAQARIDALNAEAAGKILRADESDCPGPDTRDGSPVPGHVPRWLEQGLEAVEPEVRERDGKRRRRPRRQIKPARKRPRRSSSSNKKRRHQPRSVKRSERDRRISPRKPGPIATNSRTITKGREPSTSRYANGNGHAQFKLGRKSRALISP